MTNNQNSSINRRHFAALIGTAALASLTHDEVQAAPAPTTNPKSDINSDPGLAFPPPEIYSLYGFRLATALGKDGAKTKVWLAATEQDFVQAEARRTGKKPEEIKTSKPKEMNGELVLGYDSCALGQHGFCIGGCSDGGCRVYKDANYYYCACEKS